MNPILEAINHAFRENDDYMEWKQLIGTTAVSILGLSSLIDFPKSFKAIESQLGDYSRQEILLRDSKEKDVNEYIQAMLDGKLVIVFEGESVPIVFVDAVAQNLDRPVAEPTNNTVLQGPLNAFTESIQTNLGMIQKELITDQLSIKSYAIGKTEKKKISILYLKDKVKNELVEKVTQQLEKHLKSEVYTLQDLLSILGGGKKNLLSYFYKTELPQEVHKSLGKGKVAIILDRYPFALILPNQLSDMFFLENDKNYTFPLMIAMRTLRIVGILLALILPGMYVALVAVNPEMLRVELAMAVAESREGVPYPAFVEAIILLLILELILEASVRLPKSIGPTITMVGGIIIGQAAVDARLVSNLLIIVLAATTIASSSIVGLQNTLLIRVFKYIIMIFSAVFGVFGLFVGLFAVISYVASFSVMGMPYFPLKGVDKDG